MRAGPSTCAWWRSPFGVVGFWRRLTLEERGTRLRRAQFQLVYWRTQARDAYSTLCLSPRLTEAGR